MKLLSVKDILQLTRKIGLSNIFLGVRNQIYNDFSKWEEFDKISRVASHSKKGVIELMPISNKNMYSMKYVNGHPSNYLYNNLPTVMAFGVLAKVETGEPILLSEMTFSTAIRTAATSVLAAELVGRKNPKSMAIIGNGAQSEFQALAFHYLMGVNHFKLHDIDKDATTKLVHNLSKYKNITTVQCDNTREACKDVDIITTITADKQYQTIIDETMLSPGQHINAVGGDCPGKTELSKNVLLQSSVFTEYTSQTRVEGDIQQMSEDFPVTELQEVIRLKKYQRKKDEITVFDSVGFALEDYSTLTYFYNLSERYDIGTKKSDLIAKTKNPKDLFSLLL
jgi:ornithine cyclodeaminase